MIRSGYDLLIATITLRMKLWSYTIVSSTFQISNAIGIRVTVTFIFTTFVEKWTTWKLKELTTITTISCNWKKNIWWLHPTHLQRPHFTWVFIRKVDENWKIPYLFSCSWWIFGKYSQFILLIYNLSLSTKLCSLLTCLRFVTTISRSMKVSWTIVFSTF